MKPAAKLATLTAVVLVAATAVALAHDKTYGGGLTLQYNGAKITGKLTSPKAACEKHRLLRGEYQTYGAHEQLPTVRTDANGRYSIPFETNATEFGLTVIAIEKTLKNTASHRHVCKLAGKQKNIGV